MAPTDTKSDSNIITRRLHAVIRGSLQQFSATGQESACWGTQNGRIGDIMGLTEILDGTGDQASATAMLQNALLHKVSVLEYKNEFPVSLGVSLSCVPNVECTRTGTSYAFSALPTNSNSNPLTIFANEASTNESLAWRSQYPDYNINNLDTHGVLNVQNENFVFVSKDHPVIDLLRANKTVLNADIDQQTLIDDQWLKVTKQVMATCCQQLKSKVLSKVGTCDLNSLQLQIARLDGPWAEMTADNHLFQSLASHPSRFTGIENATEEEQTVLNEQFKADADNLLNTPYAFHARLEVQYEIMPTVISKD